MARILPTPTLLGCRVQLGCPYQDQADLSWTSRKPVGLAEAGSGLLTGRPQQISATRSAFCLMAPPFGRLMETLAGALAGMGDRPTRAGGISQVNRPVHHRHRPKTPVLIGLAVGK